MFTVWIILAVVISSVAGYFIGKIKSNLWFSKELDGINKLLKEGKVNAGQ